MKPTTTTTAPAPATAPSLGELERRVKNLEAEFGDPPEEVTLAVLDRRVRDVENEYLPERVKELEEQRRRGRLVGLFVLGLAAIALLNWLEGSRRRMLADPKFQPRPEPPAVGAPVAPPPAPADGVAAS